MHLAEAIARQLSGEDGRIYNDATPHDQAIYKRKADNIVLLIGAFLDHNRGTEFDDTPETRRVISCLETGYMP